MKIELCPLCDRKIVRELVSYPIYQGSADFYGYLCRACDLNFYVIRMKSGNRYPFAVIRQSSIEKAKGNFEVIHRYLEGMYEYFSYQKGFDGEKIHA